MGGTNPSLLDAMVMKNIIIAHDNEFNKEVGGDCLIYFDTPGNLAARIDRAEADINEYYKLKENVYMRVKNDYSWNSVVNAYEQLFNAL